MSRWQLTVRHGSDVSREAFEDLDEAVAEMRRRALAIRSEGPLEGASMLRDFSPAEQVRARLQLSGQGLLRRRSAGVDIRGDGTFMPYSGSLRRKELDPTEYETPFDLVRETLEAEAP